MKKRLVLTNALLLFLSLTLFLSISIFFLVDHNKQASEKELKNDLEMTKELFNGANYDYVIDTMNEVNPELRITFISLIGDVIRDSSFETQFDSHLNREEIKDLGTVYTRYSDTLELQMIYLANSDDGAYIRVSLPYNSIKIMVQNYIIAEIVIFFIIIILSVIILLNLNSRSLKPLNEIISRFAFITNNKIFYNSDSLSTLTNQIEEINHIIKQKINDITNEKEKINSIVNNINQGIIAINITGDISLINNFALSLFDVKTKDITNKNYMYLIRDINLQEYIERSINSHSISTIDIIIKEKTYLCSIDSVNSKWLGINEGKNGVIIIIMDVTEVRKIEKMKRDFFANASHELKSPLTTIIGYQQMINENIIKSKSEITDANTRILSEATRMDKIVKEMLSLSELENKADIFIEPINVKDAVEKIINSLKKSIKAKKITINKNMNDLSININSNHLNQLLRNLIENAIKYNVEGGRIELTIEENMFIISDSGIGIDNKNQTRIFERFYQVNHNRNKDTGGTGLGLSIVKHICTLYHADIILSSFLGKGTKIIISFPTKNTANNYNVDPMSRTL